jgi:hypothetical protein
VKDTARKALDELRNRLRRASVAQVGGFRPPDDPRMSWFGRGVGHPGEPVPKYNGKEMFPLLQVNVSELSFVPPELSETALLVVYHNRDSHPFGKPHGEGWLIREYSSLADLVPLPSSDEPEMVRPFPLRWTLVTDDAPGWEDAWSVVDMASVNEDDEARETFFSSFNRYSATKIGGYPSDIQHGVGLDGFVFQIGSEEKARWMWADNGIGYFFKSDGQWRWECQFY